MRSSSSERIVFGSKNFGISKVLVYRNGSFSNSYFKYLYVLSEDKVNVQGKLVPIYLGSVLLVTVYFLEVFVFLFTKLDSRCILKYFIWLRTPLNLFAGQNPFLSPSKSKKYSFTLRFLILSSFLIFKSRSCWLISIILSL